VRVKTIQKSISILEIVVCAPWTRRWHGGFLRSPATFSKIKYGTPAQEWVLYLEIYSESFARQPWGNGIMSNAYSVALAFEKHGYPL
jgi:hypothetical protein